MSALYGGLSPLVVRRRLAVAGGPGPVGILDVAGVTGLVAIALGTERLIDSYTGPLFRVQRDDGQEADVFPNAAGAVDSPALLAWKGTSTRLWGRNWYDQGPRGQHASQTSPYSRPLLAQSPSGEWYWDFPTDGVGRFWAWPFGAWSGATSGGAEGLEVLIHLRQDFVREGGLWYLATAGDVYPHAHYTWGDGVVYDNGPSTMRSIQFGLGQASVAWGTYAVASRNGYLRARHGTTAIDSRAHTTNSTFALDDSPSGGATTVGVSMGGAFIFGGSVSQILGLRGQGGGPAEITAAARNAIGGRSSDRFN